MSIGSKCHKTSMAATQFGSESLPHKEVLIAYCLPRNSWKNLTVRHLFLEKPDSQTLIVWLFQEV